MENSIVSNVVNLNVSFRLENREDYPAKLSFDPIHQRVSYCLLNEARVPVFVINDFRKTAVEYFKEKGSIDNLSFEDMLHLQGPARAIYAARIHNSFFNGKYTTRQYMTGSMSLGYVSDDDVDHYFTHVANARWVKGIAPCKISLRKRRVLSEVKKTEKYGGFGSITVISSQKTPAVLEALNKPDDKRIFLFLNNNKHELTTGLEDYLLTRIRINQFLTKGFIPIS